MEVVEIPAQIPRASRPCQKSWVLLATAAPNQLVGTTWIIASETVLFLAKSPRSDRGVCMDGVSEDSVPSHP